MKIGRREILLLAALGFIIYAFLGINFIWLDFFDNYKSKSSDYAEVKNEYDSLKYETKNINILKKDLSSSKLANERIGQYVADYDNVIDALIYLKKLTAILPSEIKDIKVNAPEIVSQGEAKKNAPNNSPTNNSSLSATSDAKKSKTYIKINVEFSTSMKYENVKELVNYIEGSAKKVTISNLELSPTKLGEESESEAPAITNDLDVKVTLNLYSLGIEGTEDSLDDFTEFSGSTNEILNLNNLEELQETLTSNDNAVSNSDKNSKNKGVKKATKNDSKKKSEIEESASSIDSINDDIVLNLDGFLYGGPNFRLYGFDKTGESLTIKTDKREKLKVNFKGNIYTLSLIGEAGDKKLSGAIPNNDSIGFQVNVSMLKAETDKNIGVDIIVENETAQNVNIKVNDKQNRIVFMDRNGNVVTSPNNQEKLIIQ